MRTQLHRSLFLVLLFVFISITASAQFGFQRTFGGSSDDIGWSIRPSGDGNYIIVGSTASFVFGQNDIIVMKVTPTGQVLWSKNIGSTTSEELRGGAVLNGKLYGAGQTDDFGPGTINGVLAKVDLATGSLDYARGAGFGLLEIAEDADISSNGDVFISGYSFQNGIDHFVAKYDTSGNLGWARTIGSTTNAELGMGGVATSDGGYLAFGVTDQGAGSDDLYFFKLDTAGSVQWSKVYGTNQQDLVADVLELPDGYFTVGRLPTGGNDIMAMKLNFNGNIVWSKSYGGSGNDQPRAAYYDGSAVYVAGNTASFGFGGNDGFLMKLDTSGNFQWARAYGSGFDELIYDMTGTASGGFMLTGSSTGAGGGLQDIYVVATDSLGAVGCGDTSFTVTPANASLISTTPATTLSSAGGSSMNKAWSEGTPNLVLDTICALPGCIVTPLMSLSDTSFCPGDTLLATDMTFGGIGRTWKLDGVPVDTNVSTVQVLTMAGTYTFTLVADNGGCQDSIDQTIIVHPIPTLSMSGIAFCRGDSIGLNNTTPGATGASWYIGAQLVGTQMTELIPLDTVGTFTLSLESTPGGCRTDTSFVVSDLPTANFSYTNVNLDYNFTDASTGAISWSWDFGDGNSSTQQNPMHSYTASGQYVVCLTVLNAPNCEDTFCDTVDVIMGVASAFGGEVRLWPNPSTGRVRIEVPDHWMEGIEARLIDMAGREVLIAIPEAGQLDLGEAPAGVYLLELRSGTERAVVRVLKE